MIELHDVSRSYRRGADRTLALRPVSLTAPDGAVTWLAGASGSGKSTLLGIAGLLVRPDAGSVRLDGVDVTHASEAERTAARQRLIGFVPQQPRLFGELTAAQNVALATGRARVSPSALTDVGLRARAHHPAKTLSGGEQQRVAFTRAIQHAPAALLADEPTSALDDANAHAILQLIRRLADEGRCVIVASHDARLGEIADATLTLTAGAR